MRPQHDIAGADPKYAGGASGPIASYVVWLASENVDVITLQEVCSGQHSAVRDRLGPNWSDTFKNFGRVHGCGGAKFGLSIFTKGPHSDPWWKYLDGSPLGDLDKTDNETKNDGAWGLLKVRFKGIDVYSVHIRSFHRRKQIPQLAGLLIKPGSRKAIVAGDFNETPDHGRMTPFYDAWHECDAFNRPTLQTKGTKIDYIWTSWKPFQIFGGPVGTCKVDFTLDGVSAYYPTCARRFARHSPPGHSETAASRDEPAQRLLAHDQPKLSGGGEPVGQSPSTSHWRSHAISEAQHDVPASRRYRTISGRSHLPRCGFRKR